MNDGIKARYHWWDVAMQLVAASVIIYWFLYTPAPNKAVLILTFLTAAMATFDTSKWSKLIYLGLILCLMGVENRAINKDRADTSDAENRRRKEQNDKFQGIADQLQASLDNNNQQFAASMGKYNQILQNITGVDSYGIVVPQNFGENIPVLVWNVGKQPLLGVTLTIAHTTEANWGSAFFKPYFVGNIAPGDHAAVAGVVLNPTTEPATAQDNYWIQISAQNGTVHESLMFRKNHKAGVPWPAYSYIISRSVEITDATPEMKKAFPRGKIPKGTNIMKMIRVRHWSDEKDEPH
jgi:hypothetical protein